MDKPASEQTLDERMQQWEREKKGLIGDLQAEREKRHGLEERLGMIESSLKTAEEEEQAVPVDERVNRLAKDPDSYITHVVRPGFETLENRLNRLEQERKFEKAYRWLAKTEKVDEEEIRGSNLEKEIVRIVKDHGMASMDPVEGTRAAYKIYQQEIREKESREKERSEAINGNATETAQAPRGQGTTQFTREQIAGMSIEEFKRRQPEILEAQKKGLIK